MKEELPCSVGLENGDGVERVIEHDEKHARHCHHLLLDGLSLRWHLQVTQEIENTSDNGQNEVEITDHNSKHRKSGVDGVALI